MHGKSAVCRLDGQWVKHCGIVSNKSDGERGCSPNAGHGDFAALQGAGESARLQAGLRASAVRWLRVPVFIAGGVEVVVILRRRLHQRSGDGTVQVHLRPA